MPTFKKKIVKPDVYNANAPFKGNRETAVLSRGKIQKIAATGNRMLEAGIKIPAPLAHRDQNKAIPKPLKDGEEASWNSGINGGYWEKFEVDETDGGLVGYVDIPDEDLAKKVGKSIKETSIFLMPKWTDGSGEVWEDALWHVALVDAKAVERNQENFEPTKDQELALAMSISMSDALDNDNPSTQGNNDSALISSVKKLLEEKLEVSLPDDTSEVNFLDRLFTALTALKSEEENEDLTKQPSSTESPSSPIAMSQQTPEQSDAALELIRKKQDGIAATLLKQLKKDYVTRIESLVKRGFIGKKVADNWTERANAVSMSFDDLDLNDETGELEPPEFAIEMAISALETDGTSIIDPETTTSIPENAEEVGDPEDMKDTSEEDAKAIEQFLELI